MTGGDRLNGVLVTEERLGDRRSSVVCFISYRCSVADFQ